MGFDAEEALWDNAGRPSHDDDEYGPIVTATFESECAGDWDTCDGVIRPGDEIRGKGGQWFHVGCEA